MKLTRKLLLVEVLFFFLLVAGVSATTFLLAAPEVREIEKDYLLDDLARVENSLNKELEIIARLATDWAEWDDTYNYIHAPYKAYEEANLIPVTLDAQELDFLILLDNNNNNVTNKIVSSQIVNPEQFSLFSERKWPQNHPALQSFDEPFTGFFYTDDNIILLARNPILTSNGDGPSRGNLFFGKVLTEDVVQSLKDELQLDFSITVKPTRFFPAEVKFITSNHSESKSYIALSNRDDAGLAILIQQERPFYQEMLKIAQYIVVTLLIVGLIACVLTYALLRKLLVNPIILLKNQAELFRSKNDASSFKLLDRNDELGALSSSFVTMAHDLSENWNKLENERDLLQDACYTDPLTNLRNRRFLIDYFEDLNTWRYSSIWTVFTLDIDHFKIINDKYGHDIGDIVLQQFSSLLTQSCRDSDLLVRSGGEEFTVLSQYTDAETAKKIAERIRTNVAEFRFGENNSIPVTCSIGFFSLRIDSVNSGMNYHKAMLKISDMALYTAKNNGRNTWIGLDCHHGCSEGTYPETELDLKQWVIDKKLKLLALKPTHKIEWRREAMS